jgi:hypothetical protein
VTLGSSSVRLKGEFQFPAHGQGKLKQWEQLGFFGLVRD